MRGVALLAAASLVGMPASAQVSAWPEETRQTIARLGATMGPPALGPTRATLAPLIPPPVVEPRTGLPYGPHERHRLDLYSPGAGSRPVLVFVHGGGFVAGDTTIPGTPYYGNVGQWAARQGWVGVNVAYRLAPAFTYPAARDDLAAALDWVRTNIGGHGGDPARIVLMGQSAGAAHVADYLATHSEAPGVAAAVLLSGIYDVASYPPGPTAGSYHGRDTSAEVLRGRSALPGLARLGIPLVVARAELEPAAFREQAALLQGALCAARPACPPILDLAGHTHFSTIYGFGSADRQLADAVLTVLPR